jgi:hypothetical protein
MAKRQRKEKKQRNSYRVKHELQGKGIFYPTSPFYLPPALKAEALRCLEAHEPLPAYARLG